MKTVKEIRDEIERQTELNKLNIVNDIIRDIESNIKQHIQAGQSMIRILEYCNKEYVTNYDKIRLILEDAGYKVERTEYDYFNRKKEIIEKYIYISWE